ncbi:hypothetical protein [Prevotella sp.]|uniref:hypothetical protein n=1 Tax=Prevotella sp. TaxID=59823 RepID=UPI002ABDB5A3|nr:hypothetical protein [Prevotella sp.]
MDKDFLEKILKGGITVQGDFVMEKQVENEIGNVEAGGIGIQIVHGSSDKNKSCPGPNANADSLALLDTPEAQQLWKKAIEAGWVDADRQPTSLLGTKAARAVFANVMIEKLNIPQPSYEPFEALWGETNLRGSYSSGNSYDTNVKLKEKIRQQLR